MRHLFLKRVALGLALSTGLTLLSESQAFFGKKSEEKSEEKAIEKKDEKATDKKVEKKEAEKKPEGQAKEGAEAEKKPEGTTPAATPAVKDDTVVAKVNGETLTLGDLRRAYENLPPQVQAESPFEEFIKNKAAYAALLEREISLMVVGQKARAEGYDKKESVRKKREQCYIAMMLKEYLDTEVDKRLTDEKLKPKYQEVLKLMPKGKQELMLRIIVLKTEEDAKKALDRIKKGEDFSAVAKDVSEDPQTKQEGGKLGVWIREIDLQALGLSNDDISHLVSSVKATNVQRVFKLDKKGYALFRIDEKRPMTPPTYEQTKRQLKDAVAPAEAAEVIAELIKVASIERKDTEGNPLPAPQAESAEGKAEKKEETKTVSHEGGEKASKEVASK